MPFGLAEWLVIIMFAFNHKYKKYWNVHCLLYPISVLVGELEAKFSRKIESCANGQNVFGEG